ncbi:hypothetical protein TRFO_12532 [Tritrichomonas foetus]|uniref:Dynein axonemal assembly factor 5 TPR repeats domain-containing protein n=1 Tax=Tritrichomonas foetus TaxID=1144522 RepID=A0A1J4L5I7_9EUKA|nr:hypothetical protein TRFO_12532 [Tritrichomonas foetus]|eukprot:OHT17214.1 hypothetical protein TRFO_12532 [Tritrichomonas foetus]
MTTDEQTEIINLIKQLDNPIRSAKNKGSDQLLQIQINPSSYKESFFQNIYCPILKHFSNETEHVRENCIQIIKNLIVKVDTKYLHQIVSNTLPVIFSRLKNDCIEPAEQIRIELMNLLLQIIQMIDKNTNPSHLNDYANEIIDPFVLSFTSSDPQITKKGCFVLNEFVIRCSSEYLNSLCDSISPLLLKNCSHKHYEIRKLSLNSLTMLYIHSNMIDDVEKVYSLIQKLVDDKNTNVRKEVISFCFSLLTKHSQKESLYFPFLIPLMVLARPMIQDRPISPNLCINPGSSGNNPENSNNSNYSQLKLEEAQLAFNSINTIASNNMNDSTSQEENLLNSIVRNLSNKFLNTLLPMTTEWTETLRKYGFSALITFLSFCGKYLERYGPLIMQRIIISLRDFKEESIHALQCQAILSNSIPAQDILNFLLPCLSDKESNNTNDILLLLQVSIINGNFDENQILQILNELSKILKIGGFNQQLINFIFAITQKPIQISDSGKVFILKFILELNEKCEILNSLTFLFNQPKSQVFAQYFLDLLNSKNESPQFLIDLLFATPLEIVKTNQSIVLDQINTTLSSIHKNPNNSNKKYLDTFDSLIHQFFS